MKNIFLTFLAVLFCVYPLCAAAPSEGEVKETEATPAVYEPYGAEFYKDFISAAWYEKHGEYKKAFEFYEKLNEVLPGDKAILKSLSSLAVATENAEGMDKYIPLLIAAAPGEPNTISLNATWLWSKGKLNEALALYEKAIKMQPDNPEIIFKYVTLLSGIDSERAVNYLKSLSKAHPSMAGAISLQIADLYLQSNDNDGAVDYLKEAVKQYPEYAEPYLGLVKIFESRGDGAGALQQYLAMEKAGIADAEILTKIGAYYLLDNKRELSVQYFLKAKALENDNPLAAQFLTLDAQSKGDFAAAVRYLTESADFASGPGHYVRASYFYNRLGDMPKSAAVLAEAYAKFNDNLEIALYYSLALIDLKDFKTAEQVLREALKKSPDNESLLFHYAFVLERQQKYKEMEKQLRRLLEIAPEHADGLNFLGYYLVDKTKKVEEGGEYIKKAVVVKPGENAFIDSLAWYYYKTGDYEKAQNLLESILEAAGADWEITLHAAAVYEALGDYQKAVQYYKATLAADPENKDALKGLRRAEKKIK